MNVVLLATYKDLYQPTVRMQYENRKAVWPKNTRQRICKRDYNVFIQSGSDHRNGSQFREDILHVVSSTVHPGPERAL